MVGRRKGHAGTWRIHECGCQSRECRVCAFTSDLQPAAAEEEEGLLCLCFMSVLYVGAVEGSTLPVAGYVAGTIGALLNP